MQKRGKKELIPGQKSIANYFVDPAKGCVGSDRVLKLASLGRNVFFTGSAGES